MTEEPSDLAQMLFEQANAMREQFALGMKFGKEVNRLAVAALEVAYDRAQQDQETKIPTPLMCAIENILRLQEQEQINDYANAAIKRDQLERHEGRADHEQDTRGAALKAGS